MFEPSNITPKKSCLREKKSRTFLGRGVLTVAAATRQLDVVVLLAHIINKNKTCYSIQLARQFNASDTFGQQRALEKGRPPIRLGAVHLAKSSLRSLQKFIPQKAASPLSLKL